MNRLGLAGRLAQAFAGSKLTPLLVVAALGLGALALIATPREEEPQIRVPMIDLRVAWPGAEPAEVEGRVVDPLERALWGLSGLEHLYSTATPGGALLTARFEVGASYEESLVKVYERVAAVAAQLPPGVKPPAVSLHTIDDVPFLALTLWQPGASSEDLRPLAAELARELAEIPTTHQVRVIGGTPRAVRVEPDLDRLAAAGVGFSRVAGAVESAGLRQPAGSGVSANRETHYYAGAPLASAEEIAALVVAVQNGRPVYLRDVARVIDGPDEATDAVFFVHTEVPADSGEGVREHAAVTVALAKRPGANATRLAEEVLAKVAELRPRLLPAEVQITVTRDYGHTAAEKSAELVKHLVLATLSVVFLIALAMGWRSGLVVGIAVPVTLALTLAIYALAGYTLNRVTLFALIFSIGILVDDAIVVVENIERHLRARREHPGRSLLSAVIAAVDEVGNPTILATFTVIAAILPMAFVRGLMGPYMRPIPTGASAAMLFSLGVAFVVSPWAALWIFRHARHEDEEACEVPTGEGWTTRVYRRVMTALLTRPAVRWGFFVGMTALLAGAVSLVVFGGVKVKMLPFDNKSELQVLVEQEEGTPLEVTLETARTLARELAQEPVVRDVQVYAGTAAPVNFNGLVRHYFLRRSPASADLQVNLVPKDERELDSHALAKALRPRLAELAAARGARVKVVEIPPGPPVLDTLVAEIYGPTAAAREALARQVHGLFTRTAGVVDVDDSLPASRERVVLTVDREKAVLHGVPPAAVTAALAGAGAGVVAGHLDVPAAREPVPIRLQLAAADRAHLTRRLELRVEAPAGPIALAELVTVSRAPEPQPILHKDLKPVVYVFGDLAGERESPVYALAELNRQLDGMRLADGSAVERYSTAAPRTSERPALKWDGEWQITYEVFRDLGIAFAVVLVLIAILVIGWFRSFTVPIAILLPIPLSLVGILPGHYLFGAFFTATSMIGFIAGAGIIVRNSIILVDFIELARGRGASLADAVIEAGAVRFRPMLLTAAAVVVGSAVILFDPIFQGLALSLMMGEVAATLLSRFAVPVVYFLLQKE